MDAAGLRRLQGLAQRIAAQRPELLNAEATVGELACFWARDLDTLGPFWRHRLWCAGDEVVGWGWACLPHRIPRADGSFRVATAANLSWQVKLGRFDLLPRILDWYDGVAAGADRQLIVQSADAEAQAIVAAQGYRFDAEAGGEDGPWVQFNIRDLAELPAPVLPAGFRFLSAAEVSPDAAVRAHHDAWPGSTLTEAAFRRMQRTWPYRPALHPLIAAADGTLVATAILWLDEVSRTAEFEPVGTHRAFRRQGLGRALQWHGMRLARDAGATHALVAFRGAPKHAAARGLYEGVGFRPLGRDLPQIKRG